MSYRAAGDRPVCDDGRPIMVIVGIAALFPGLSRWEIAISPPLLAAVIPARRATVVVAITSPIITVVVSVPTVIIANVPHVGAMLVPIPVSVVISPFFAVMAMVVPVAASFPCQCWTGNDG